MLLTLPSPRWWQIISTRLPNYFLESEDTTSESFSTQCQHHKSWPVRWDYFSSSFSPTFLTCEMKVQPREGKGILPVTQRKGANLDLHPSLVNFLYTMPPTYLFLSWSWLLQWYMHSKQSMHAKNSESFMVAHLMSNSARNLMVYMLPWVEKTASLSQSS